MEPSSTNFSTLELRCQCRHCNLREPSKIDPAALKLLQALRTELDEPLSLSSAYRCAEHPSEAKKTKPGTHNKGVAFDIRVPWGAKRIRIIAAALRLGFKGFGFADSFLHIDIGSDDYRSWDYS